jgi:hypothetical protein
MLKSALGLVAASLLAGVASAATPELPPLPAPETAIVPISAPPLVPVPDAQLSPPVSLTAEPIYLYTNVKVEDLDNVPRGAVPTVIAIPDPCLPGCVRYIEICALPDCQPRVHSSPSGRKIEYDYGTFEVEIYNRSKYVVVNYDD